MKTNKETHTTFLKYVKISFPYTLYIIYYNVHSATQDALGLHVYVTVILVEAFWHESERGICLMYCAAWNCLKCLGVQTNSQEIEFDRI